MSTTDLGPFAAIVEAIADAVATRLADRDELVPIAASPLAAHGLELRAVQRLIEDGKLRAVSIGRRRFTRRSYLLALVDELPAATRTDVSAEEPDALQEALAKAARRQDRRAAQVHEIRPRGERAA